MSNKEIAYSIIVDEEVLLSLNTNIYKCKNFVINFIIMTTGDLFVIENSKLKKLRHLFESFYEIYTNFFILAMKAAQNLLAQKNLFLKKMLFRRT